MYFDRFKDIYYEFIINGKSVLKTVKDITTNVRFRKELLANITLYDEYDIKEGETPDIIAAKIYGSSEYHWVVMLCNERFNYIEDYPLGYHALETYIQDKYGNDMYDTHHYENSEGYVVNSDYPGAYPVSNYDYETRLNETKRRIKLISPSLLTTILNNYKEVL